jgi:predicted acetyltransferase
MDPQVDLEIRPVTRDELAAYTRADFLGFGEADPHPELTERSPGWRTDELDRTVAAFDGGEIVGTGRSYSLEVTLPGGAFAPGGAVSAITVTATHRRRGILTRMMGFLLDDAVARGEPLAMLWASEGTIYRRFGYGIASTGIRFHIDRRDTAFLRPVTDPGRVRIVDDDSARKLFPGVFERVRHTEPGAVSRTDSWWNDVFFMPGPERGARFYAVHESPTGEIDGCVAYRIKEGWTRGVSRNELSVSDLLAATPEVRLALWRFVFDIDLIETIDASAAVDDPVRHALREGRRAVVDQWTDLLWVRILDVPGALGARQYAVDGRLVLEVEDDFRPDGGAAGRFVLETGPDGAASHPTDDPPDLTLGVADLGALYLGGTACSTLAGAGLVQEHTPGAVARADAMFVAHPAPYTSTNF